MLAFVSACLVVGCGDDGGGADTAVSDAGDGGVADGGTDADPVMVEAAREAALPDLTPCAPGWRAIEEDGLTLCEPWPAGGRATCASSFEAHLPGDSACGRLGSACPSGSFAEGLPTDAIYVDSAASLSGDGSATSPFSSITEALAALGFRRRHHRAVGRDACGQRHHRRADLTGRRLCRADAPRARVGFGRGGYPRHQRHRERS